MTDLIWQEPPTIQLLQWLARGSLKQNLLQAVRLWVWLRLLYGPEDEQLALPNTFTYADWRDRMFTPKHPSTDQKPSLHDPTCPCAKVTAAWIFAPELTDTQLQWQQHCSQPYEQSALQQQVGEFRQALADHDQLPTNFHRLLFETRLFGATRRTLYGDLRRLSDICWLRQSEAQFAKVSTWPDYPRHEHSGALASGQEMGFFTQPDLAAIAENLSRSLGDHRRFFVHVDYVISRQKLDQVDDWQALLADLWQQSPVPPLKLLYQRAGKLAPQPLITYPVCIYYYRRGPYLCAYGQVPQPGTENLGWRNYRLDRISAIQALNWNDPAIPPELLRHYREQTLPTPEVIETAMEEAWGFDYYQPSQQLLLRFDAEWNQRYIQNTLRHTTFRQVSYERAGQIIRQTLSGEPQEQLLTLWRSRSTQDAYYQARYRHQDPNVRQRLRAWRPHVEVLLPWELRQRTLDEIAKEMKFYGLH